jgi:prepilin-type N-terminal cleavage/methylation domain-containing protein
VNGPSATRDSHDGGFTLVELLISLALTLIVVAVAGGILISGLKSQQTVKSVTNAANVAQQIAQSVQAGVRNASAVTVVSDTTTGTQLLFARVIGSDAASTAASCQAWYYTPAGGGAVYTMKTTPASTIALPASGPQGVWALLGTGVSPNVATGRVFTSPAGSRVDLSYNVAADSQPYVKITTTTYTPQLQTVSSPCF